MPATNQVSSAEWQVITKKRILFGHQSVGNNILTGVRSLASQAGVNLKIIESRSVGTDFGISHFSVGRNEDPLSKINDFSDTLKSGAFKGLDVALMKLCYIDINADTDVRKLAEEYQYSLENLSKQFPHTVFIAVTAPIRTVQRGPKAWLKKIFGRMPGGYAENIRRQEYNDILRHNCGQLVRLFDLAMVEAEGAGNCEFQGKSLEVLNPLMSDDGGHLNAHGQHYVAAKLLKFIATLPHNP